MTQLFESITPYAAFWPLLVITSILMIVGKISAVCFQPFATGWRWWAHKTLSLQPVALGALIGLMLEPRMPGVANLGEMVLACAGCGLASVWLYQVAKGLAKKKGYDIDLPGLEGENDDT